jgi:hypothetical protein
VKTASDITARRGESRAFFLSVLSRRLRYYGRINRGWTMYFPLVGEHVRVEESKGVFIVARAYYKHELVDLVDVASKLTLQGIPFVSLLPTSDEPG